MDDLINRQAAIEACLRYNGVGWVWSQILDEIEKMPSVDAVEVVRCKDCKSFSHGYCKFHDAKFVREDGYCYWGERKNG